MTSRSTSSSGPHPASRPIRVSTEWEVLSRKDTTPKAIVLSAQNRCPFLISSQHHQLSERTLLFDLWTCIYHTIYLVSYVWNFKNKNGGCGQRRNAWINKWFWVSKHQTVHNWKLDVKLNLSVINLTAKFFISPRSSAYLVRVSNKIRETFLRFEYLGIVRLFSC